MKISTFKRWSEVYFLVLICVLAIGIPLVFTSLTRSVFEVNKLMLLRIVTILVCSGWIFKSLVLNANHVDDPEDGGPSYQIFGIKWRKIGLEIPLLIFLIFNILSTVFSQNIRLSVIGAYDRWEGILTALNYLVLMVMTAKLITKRYQLIILVVALVLPTAGSAVYGVFQSLGIDFMNWSVDPTKRVFACINNPVHFCAYMGMMVPLSLASLLAVSGSKFDFRGKGVVKWALFGLTGLIFYAQYLSFSRATWFGFSLAVPVFFLVAMGLIRTDNIRRLVVDYFTTSIGLLVFYLYYIFTFHKKSPYIGLGIGLIVTAALLIALMISRHHFGKRGLPKPKDYFLPIIGAAAVFFGFIYDLSDVGTWAGWGIRTVAILSFVGAVWVSKDEDREFLARLTTLVIFATLQFVGTSWTAIILFGVLSTIFYLTTLRGNRLVEREIKMWLLGVVLLFGAVIVTPALPGLFKATFEPDSDIKSLQVVDNVQGKLASYKKDAIEGSARVSMWQSSVPWIKQYWLIGSGLDTIKYMYPVFRRSDYGILEGGHNFTPDRLHNEYLNNLATRGVIATVVYYFGIILGWYLITLKGLVKLDRSPYRYILLAFMVGTTVYLGQVLFNFGVVATLVLFYLCIGIGWAISVHSDFEKGDR